MSWQGGVAGKCSLAVSPSGTFQLGASDATWLAHHAGVLPLSHSEDAMVRILDRRIRCDGKAQTDCVAGRRGLNDAVVPQPSGGVERMSLSSKLSIVVE